MNTHIKGFLVIILSIILIISLFGCGDSITKDPSSFFESDNDKVKWGESANTPTAVPTPKSTPVPTQTLNDSENWTIMLYMNGADLESEGGEATANLVSLLSVALPKSINVLIYTGGTTYWQNDTISADYNQIWSVAGQEIVLLENIDVKNMGESDTLSEFINYSNTNYPADKRALIFWNHGAGSILGFGADENFQNDGLYLYEMADAFSASFDGQKYDVVGFDACLMASIEMASVLAPYSKYMVASEEVEPGGGWNYEYYFGALSENPSMSGKEFGIAITDGYYKKYADTEMEGLTTCSVIDLSKIPALEDMLGTFSNSLQGVITKPDSMSTLARARQHTESYGESPGAVSFDMVDLYDFVDLQKNSDPELTEMLKDAIEDAIVHEISGSQRMYSYGLSIYFPFKAKEYFSDSFAVYNDIVFCPEYKQFIQDFARALTNEKYLNDIPEYKSSLYEETVPDPGEEDYSEIGSYYVSLSDEEMDYLYDVYCVLGVYHKDGTLLDLGFDSDITIDYSDNTIHDDFGGDWTGLNGVPVALYIMENRQNEYVIYNIPVLYNAERAVVTGAWIWDDTNEEGGYYIYTGIYYSNDEYSPPNTKFSIELEIGDEIIPLYSAIYAEDGYDGYYEGEPFYLDENGLYLELIWLPDGVYEYGFLFVDNYGNQHYSDFIDFELSE